MRKRPLSYSMRRGHRPHPDLQCQTAEAAGSAPCAELSPSEGWLCLVYDNVAADGNKVNYQIMPELPDLYFLSAKEAETLEEIAYYPLAFLTKNEDYWMVRQLVRYVIPQLWLPKECEDEEEENGGETEGNE